MKSILTPLIFCSFLILSGCTARRPYLEITSSIDYSEYTKSGFFFTESNSVSFDYTPIGKVTATITSGYVGKEFAKATNEATLWLLHKKALEMKANGIINLEFSYSSGDYVKNNSFLYLDKQNNYYDSITATGMAIRRKSAR
jgi:uncharacterized protein YbjQ (UPF0145 family)